MLLCCRSRFFENLLQLTNKNDKIIVEIQRRDENEHQ